MYFSNLQWYFMYFISIVAKGKPPPPPFIDRWPNRHNNLPYNVLYYFQWGKFTRYSFFVSFCRWKLKREGKVQKVSLVCELWPLGVTVDFTVRLVLLSHNLIKLRPQTRGPSWRARERKRQCGQKNQPPLFTYASFWLFIQTTFK